MSIPQDLLKQAEQGNLLLFIGDRVARTPDGQSLIDHLSTQLQGQLDPQDWEVATFPHVAQTYEDIYGRARLVQFLQEQIGANSDEPHPVYRLIAKLDDCRFIVSTDLDRQLEQAFHQVKRPLQIWDSQKDEQSPAENAPLTQIFYLYGTADGGEAALRITEEDYEVFLTDPHSLSAVLQGYLARSTLLFLGYDLADPYFKRLYRKVTAGLDNHARRNYIVTGEPTPTAARWCERHQLEAIEAEPVPFLQVLIEQLQARAQTDTIVSVLPDGPPALVLPERPYKLLDYYEAEDSAIFFGRGDDTRQLASLIHAHRLVILYGASGTGKTSLLLAGAAPFLKQSEPRYDFIYIRALEDPVDAIKRALRRRLPTTLQGSGSDTVEEAQTAAASRLRTLLNKHFGEGDLRELCFDLAIDYEELPGSSKRDKTRELIIYCERRGRLTDLLAICRRQRPHVVWPDHRQLHSVDRATPALYSLPEDAPLVDVLDLATRVLDRTLILILDQFEEFFIRLSPQYRAAFIAELGSLYDASDVSVKVILSLREDWLAAVSEIEERIPGVFRNRMRLLPLTRVQARQAITAPVAPLGVHYDPDLEQRLLDDLVGSDGDVIMPPQLQLVCHTLFLHLGENEKQIHLAAYEKLGGARGILRQYLDDELSRFKPEERMIARMALEELVTSQGTKAVKSSAELALAFDLAQEQVQPILEKMVRARLLRALEHQAGGIAYELAHEYLIQEINVGDQARARKQTEELVKQEVENWQRFQTLLAADKLALIGEWREVLRLVPEAQELLLRSAVQVGHDVAYWLDRVQDPEHRALILSDMARSKLPVVRQRIADILSTQDIAASVEPLLQLAIFDNHAPVRAAARTSMTHLHKQQPAIIARLCVEVEGEDRITRRHALEALAALPPSGLPLGLRSQVMMTRLRLGAAWLVDTVLGTARRRSIALAVAVVMLVVAVPYAISASAYNIAIERGIYGESAGVVIRRGHPWLPLPGLNQILVETGQDAAGIATGDLEAINQRRLWGFSWQRSESGYQQWASDFIDLLPPEEQVEWLWNLDREEAIQLLITKIGSPEDDEEACDVCAHALAEMAVLYPGANGLIDEALKVWSGDPDRQLRAKAAELLGYMGALDEAQMTTERSSVLLALLEDPEVNVRRTAAWSLYYATWYGVAARGGLGSAALTGGDYLAWVETGPIVDSLLPYLVDEDQETRQQIVYLLLLMVSDKPDIFDQKIVDSLTALLDQDSIAIKLDVLSVLQQTLAAHPEQMTNSQETVLLALLSDANEEVRGSTSGTLRQVIAANPEMVSVDFAQSIVELINENIAARPYAAAVLAVIPDPVSKEVFLSSLPLLTIDDSDLGLTIKNVLAQWIKDNPSLVTAVTVDQLIEMATDAQGTVSPQVIYVLWQTFSARPDLVTAEAADVLVGLLASENSTIRAHAMATWGELIIQQAEPDTYGLYSVECWDYSTYSYASFSSDLEPAQALGLIKALFGNSLTNTAEISDALLAAVDDEAICAAQILWTVLKADPHLVSEDALTRLHMVMADSWSFYSASSVAVAAEAVKQHPELVRTGDVKRVLALFEQEDLQYPDSAVTWLKVVMFANSDRVDAAVMGTLIELLNSEKRPVLYGDIIDILWVALAENPDLLTPEIMTILLSTLSRDDPNERISALTHWAIALTDDHVSEIEELIERPVSEIEADHPQMVEITGIQEAVRRNPATANEQMVDALIQMFTAENSAIVSEAYTTLLEVMNANRKLAGTNLVDKLLLLGNSSNSASRHYALSALWYMVRLDEDLMTEEIFSRFIEALSDTEADVRAAAIMEWGNVPAGLVTDRVLDALVLHLQDKDSSVRISALYTVWQIIGLHPELVDLEVQQVLLQSLDDADPDVRIAAINAWSFSASSELITGDAIDSFMHLLADPNASIRLSAWSAMNNFVSRQVWSPATIEQVDTLKSEQGIIQLFSNFQGSARLFEVLAQDNRVGEIVVAEMVHMLADDNLEVAEAARLALWQLLARYPERMDAKLAGELVTIWTETPLSAWDLSEEPPYVEYGIETWPYNTLSNRVSSVFLRAVAVNPTVVTPDMLTALLKMLPDSENDVRRRIVAILGHAFSANPDLGTDSVQEMLLTMVIEGNELVWPDAMIALWSLILVDARSVSGDTVEQILTLMTNEAETNFSVTASVLEQTVISEEGADTFFADVFAANPELIRQVAASFVRADVFDGAALDETISWLAAVHPDLASYIVAMITTQLESNEDWDHLDRATRLVKRLAAEQPDTIAPQLIDALIIRINHKHAPVVQNVADALEIIYEAQGLPVDELDTLFLEALFDPLNSAGRPIILDQLFEIALDDPVRADFIQTRLLSESNSRDPIVRLWANRELQLLELVNLAHAAVADPGQQEEANEKLEQYAAFLFFQEENRVAGKTLRWLEMQRYPFAHYAATIGQD